MKAGFYVKLAWDGIRKNKRLYLPYMLTGGVMVMMYYILSFLTESPTIQHMPGGSTLMSMLPLGCIVISIFSLLFLFYTNSFLIRQRYREFGLYNILGMDKKNIGRIMIWECIIVGIISIIPGLAAGITLSKTAELVLLKLVNAPVTYELSIGVKSLWKTPLIYSGIYFLLLINSLIRVWRSKPLELLKSNREGEKIPKLIWLHAVIGVILLGTAYYLAVTIEEPLTALTVFFLAVILVIAGTYELFMAGSVVLCKLLQKNKSYYYKPNHFVSVSSMVYRMRRNGAGLASICILLTMVLVMISSSASLYFGSEDTLKNRYPKGVNISITVKDIDGLNDENVKSLQNTIIESCGQQPEISFMRTGEIPGIFSDSGVTIDYSAFVDFSLSTYDNVGYLAVVSLADYNRMCGTNEVLADDECMLYCIRYSYNSDTFAMENGRPYKVKKILDEFISDGDFNSMIVPTICIVVNDFNAFVEPVLSMANFEGDPMIRFELRCGFDLETAEAELAAADAIRASLRNLDIEGKNNIYSYNVESREANREDFFNTYASLFFLGIMLSIVFLLAAVLIIYYKQISEGYEDQSRFDIMQKVGMTKKDIRRSINSQILTVFFSPLIMAGVHLAFAFSFIWKILMLFNLNNLPLVIMVTIICFLLFGIFYALVYKITSSSYYSIVSGRKDH